MRTSSELVLFCRFFFYLWIFGADGGIFER